MLFCGPVTSHPGTGIPVMILGVLRIRASQEAIYLYIRNIVYIIKGDHEICTASRKINVFIRKKRKKRKKN